MAAGNRNNRQTGARKFEAHPEEVDRDRAGLEAAQNRRPGPKRDIPETIGKTPRSDAADQRPIARRPLRTENSSRKNP